MAIKEHSREFEVWAEKYRPRDFGDVVGQKPIVEHVKAFVDNRNIPHMLFSGPAGCGKTTLALIIAQKMFGKSWRENFLDLNASDERGIDVIRHKVKDFARTKSLSDIPFKIIYLDEADALTTEAQNALRRTMENYAHTARFILSCNYSSKIIEPIQSRCAVFRFRVIAGEEIEKHSKEIAHAEKVKISESGLKAIAEISRGDMRKAINLLQTAATSKSGEISEKAVFEIAARARPADVREMLDLATNGNFAGAREKLLDLVVTQGLSGEDLIAEIHRQIFDLDVSEQDKVRLVEKTGEYDFRLSEGASDLIQLEALLAQFLLVGKK